MILYSLEWTTMVIKIQAVSGEFITCNILKAIEDTEAPFMENIINQFVGTYH